MTRTAITPRKPKFDFSGVPRHWLGGNRLATHIANGVNMLFPAGERFFVRSVNHYLDDLDDPALVAAARGFFGQEGKHAKAHDDYNELLRAQGYDIDGFLDLVQKLAYEWLEPRTPPALRLAATAAAEHFTAIMAENAFRQQPMRFAHPVMRDLLMWHAAEEIEHKSVAFDVLQKVNPSYALRVAGMAFAAALLATFWVLGAATLVWQEKLTLADLRRDLASMRAAPPADPTAPYDPGPEGIARRVFLRGIRQYLRRDFHPDHVDNYAMARDYLARYDQPAAA